MPFKRPGKDAWYTWVTACNGARRQLSTSTKLEKEAKKIESWLEDLRDRGDRHGLLAAIVSGELKLLEAYAAGPEAPALLVRRRAIGDDPDLRGFVDEWIAEEEADGLASTPKYRQMMSALCVTPLRPSDLTAVAIRKRVLALPDMQSPTRNRYLSTLSSFCRWCVRHGKLPRNPVNDVQKFRENDSPMRLWTTEEAQTIHAALPQPFRALCALMAGAGWEFAACARGRVRDLDLTGPLPTAFAWGTKNAWRERQCVITEPWALPLIREHIEGMRPNDLLFPNITSDSAVHRLQRTLTALKLPHATNHDWRHSHAVWLLQRGELPSTVAHQLGHKNTQLLWERYGRYVTTVRHYRSMLPQPAQATEPPQPPQLAIVA